MRTAAAFSICGRYEDGLSDLSAILAPPHGSASKQVAATGGAMAEAMELPGEALRLMGGRLEEALAEYNAVVKLFPERADTWLAKAAIEGEIRGPNEVLASLCAGQFSELSGSPSVSVSLRPNMAAGTLLPQPRYWCQRTTSC